MRVSIAGVVLLASFIGVSGASAQTPTPDPAPTPPPPVVEPAPPPPVVETTTTSTTTATTAVAPEPTPVQTPKPKPHRKDARDRETSPAQVPVFTHPTFAETLPHAVGRKPKVRAIPASATVAVPADAHGSAIALILVFVLGSASLLVVALKGVRIEGLSSVQAVVIDHRGEVAYASVALLLGLGVGLLATFGLT